MKRVVKNSLSPSSSRTAYADFVCAAVSICLFLLFWQYSSSLFPRARLLPPPSTVIPAFFRSFYEPIGSQTMPGHILKSLYRVFLGFSLAAVSGVTLGILSGRSRLANSIINPFIELLRPIPGIAWIPIAILWFGSGENGKVFILFIASFTIIAANTHDGARHVDPELIGAARMLGASRFRIFFTVVLPCCVPQVFTGLQIGLTINFMTVVAAEMIRSRSGVGWIVSTGNDSGNMTQVMVGLVAIGIIGFALSALLRATEKRLLRWHRN
ncbi:MAG: ABC transporter permease [Clostridiales bacterium]|nr:ABC transporter permease [Clostridiales bacterium]